MQPDTRYAKSGDDLQRIFVRLLPIQIQGKMKYEEGDVTFEAAKRRIEQLLGNNKVVDNNKVIDITPEASQKARGDDASGAGRSLRKPNGR